MLTIVTLAELGLLWVHLLGLALLLQRPFQSYALARVCAPVLLVMVCFFAEHFSGFGKLGWPWLFTTPLCVALVYRGYKDLWQNFFIEACAFAGFFYAFAWRWAFPDIDASVEKLSDLSFVANYISGMTLPPEDTWFPPYKFDFYYSLQHYAAALLGRWFGLDVGTTTNLAFCVLVSLTAAAAGAAAEALCPNRKFAALVVAAYVVGGSGASPLAHFMVEQPNAWFSMRFIGDLAKPEQVSTDFGRWFIEHAYPTGPAKPMVLPTETLGFDTTIGEFHSTLSSFFILALRIYAIALLARIPNHLPAQAVFAGSLPLCVLASMWILPLHGLLFVAWVLYRYLQKQPPNWAVMIGAGVTGLLLAFPHLRAFGLQAVYFNTQILPVGANQHTPLVAGLALLWPLLLVLVLGLFNNQAQRLGFMFISTWLGLWLLSEFFYIEDAYGGEFDRFNTSLKWWPHIYAGALLSLGALNLNSRNALSRYGTLLTLALVCVYAYDVGREWWLTPKEHKGRLDGAAWITHDLPQKALLDHLKVAAPGVVLERVAAGSYTYAPSFSLFSGHPALLGWWNGHEALWRGSRTDIGDLYNQTVSFYQAQLPNPQDWLLVNNVSYIVWLRQDNIEPFDGFDRINAQIKQRYAWFEFEHTGNTRVGLWVRKNVVAK